MRIRADHSTNFVCARKQLQEETIEISDATLQKITEKMGLICELIPPAATHCGGVWERKIGSIQRILTAAMKTIGHRSLSRDELYTLYQEAAAIVNSTPLYEVSSNPNDPLSISPSHLLTLKDNPDAACLEDFSERLAGVALRTLLHNFGNCGINNTLVTSTRGKSGKCPEKTCRLMKL